MSSGFQSVMRCERAMDCYLSVGRYCDRLRKDVDVEKACPPLFLLRSDQQVLPFHDAVHQVFPRKFDELGIQRGGQHDVVADVGEGFDRRAVVILEVVVDVLSCLEPIHQ